jgi:hypothetical protein
MNKKTTRQQEEVQSLQIFIKNKGKIFNSSLIEYPPQNDPSDITYDSNNYQITYGDQSLIGDIRKNTSKGKIYCEIRNVSNDEEKYALKFVGDALKKKLNQSSKNIILLIHCNFPGIYDPDKTERNKILQSYIKNNQNLVGKWKNIYAIFPDCNIKLH